MLDIRCSRVAVAIAAVAALVHATSARASDDFETWPELINPFPSTGGGGVMIDGYDPKVAGRTCTTDFVARLPDGREFRNEIVFDAIAVAGGTLCANGRWRAKDGSASGTTPFRVFIKNGTVRRSP